MKISDILDERFFVKDSYQEKQRGLISNAADETRFKVGDYDFYSQEVDYDEDTRKTFHTLITPDGQSISFDWSPYSVPRKEDVALWIKLGMPKREDVGSRGPIDRNDLIKLARDKGLQI